MFGHRMMPHQDYILVKKSTLAFVTLAAAGLIGYYLYKQHHRSLKEDATQLKDDAVQLKDDVVEAAKEGAHKVQAAVRKPKA